MTRVCLLIVMHLLLQMDRLDIPETLAWMQHYVASGATQAGSLPDIEDVLAVHMQTDGNANEMRKYAPVFASAF